MTTENDTLVAATKPTPIRRAKATVLPSLPARKAAIASTSKSDTVIKLLLRTKGATPLELIAATDWQAHSVRAFLSGLRKKGRALVREPRKDGASSYRIVPTPPSDAQPPAADVGCKHTDPSEA